MELLLLIEIWLLGLHAKGSLIIQTIIDIYHQDYIKLLR